MRNYLVIAGVIVVALTGGAYLTGYFDDPSAKGTGSAGKPTVKVVVPELGQIAKLGEADFNANCAICHGGNAAGTGKGPPLIHRIYEPGHHGDFSFKRAVEMGTRAHHWKFGNMPPQPQVSDQQVARIVVYVRALQKANGIF